MRGSCTRCSVSLLSQCCILLLPVRMGGRSVLHDAPDLCVESGGATWQGGIRGHGTDDGFQGDLQVCINQASSGKYAAANPVMTMLGHTPEAPACACFTSRLLGRSRSGKGCLSQCYAMPDDSFSS